MKRTLITTILTFAGATLFAQQPAPPQMPPTIKVRTGFDKKHKPVYTSLDVRTGWIMFASKAYSDSSYTVVHGRGLYGPTASVMEVPSSGAQSYTVCGVEACYSVVDMGNRVSPVWEEHADVSYAVIDKRFYLIPPAALKEGVLDAWPLTFITTTPPIDEKMKATLMKH